ncbi:hypothetical protein TNCV_3412501 [Trichonephila clavipes]|uniref:HAT C-terminal dimerisation domain-containing protein n=1 Tax=Trichonephila clavipes TaxID=2585209 RepID=A0A8X6V3N1_TRICX|nr:hypothetical protein TNCV_3412501 [Trichonephila clavipes]
MSIKIIINEFLNSRDLCDIYRVMYIALRIYPSIPAANCSGERSFCTLKRVNNYLRADMKQDELNALALLSIEAQLVEVVKYEDVIDFRTDESKKQIYYIKAGIPVFGTVN